MHNIYVGWDSREDIAYQVCEHSILRRTRSDIRVVPLKQSDLRAKGVYTRDVDKLASTEFTFTRFLVPHLNEYTGWAVFCDSDMVFLMDAVHLFDNLDNTKAVYCVQHDYNPPEGLKMDGQIQTQYPRKNWSSMMIFNCEHPSTQQLTVERVNTATGAYLHRFEWCDDSEIGILDCSYNWLVGHYSEGVDGTPKILHYTEGGPWFENMRNCAYDHVWKREVINLYSS